MIQKLVYIVQDVWHSKHRIVRQLPRDHPNYHSCVADLAHVYRQCRPSADEVGLLKSRDPASLSKELKAAAIVFQEDLRKLRQKFNVCIPSQAEDFADSISMIAQVYKAKDAGVGVSDQSASSLGDQGRPVRQGTSQGSAQTTSSSPFQARTVGAVTSKELLPCTKVRPP